MTFADSCPNISYEFRIELGFAQIFALLPSSSFVTRFLEALLRRIANKRSLSYARLHRKFAWANILMRPIVRFCSEAELRGYASPSWSLVTSWALLGLGEVPPNS